MWLSLAADAVLLLHLAFVVFVVAGGLLVRRWPAVVWCHVPSVAWAVFVEVTGRVCPLTPLENWLVLEAGESGYSGSFLEHHLGPVLYPPDLTQEAQWLLGFLVLLCNGAIYMRILRRRLEGRRSREQ